MPKNKEEKQQSATEEGATRLNSAFFDAIKRDSLAARGAALGGAGSASNLTTSSKGDEDDAESICRIL